MTDFKNIRLRLHSLAIFRQLLSDPVISALDRLLSFLPEDENAAGDGISSEKAVDACGEFASLLYKSGGSLTRYILTLALEDENVYMLKKAESEDTGAFMDKALAHELDTLQLAASVSAKTIKEAIHGDDTDFLPGWETEDVDFKAVYSERLGRIREFGYGVFAKYTTFMIEDGKLVPVKHPDAITLSELGGYQRERQLVIDNTVALIEGRPAANTLLYGDAGTGKSSTVKAVANAYAKDGLRLIEIRKNQLHEIPHLVDQLSKNPLRFILFIDDLSFSRDDDNFAALKAILEGSVSARANNLAVYATSNRRHLIKEDFSDRQGTDLHLSDTIQELTSLSDRFGLTVTFQKPGKQVYLEIVHDLAIQNGISLPVQELDKQAEAFAIGRGGRSPRAAKQFIDYLCSKG